MVDEVLGREIRLAERGEEEECIAVEAPVVIQSHGS